MVGLSSDEELWMGENESDSDSVERATPRFDPNPRFGRLMVIIVLSFMLSAFSGPLVATATVILNGLLVLVAFRTTSLRSKLPWLFPLAAVALIAIVTTATFDNHSAWQAVPAFAQLILLSVLVMALLDAVLRREVVDAQTIVGAISAYMLIGLAYGWLYLGMDLIDETQFSMAAQDTNQFPDFSFVVLTTLGFGNQLPTAALSGRVVSTEALAGQIFLAVFVARLVALYRRESRANSA